MKNDNNKDTKRGNKLTTNSKSNDSKETISSKDFRGGEFMDLDTVIEESSCSEDYCVSPRSSISKDENIDFSEPISPELIILHPFSHSFPIKPFHGRKCQRNRERPTKHSKRKSNSSRQYIAR